MNAVGNRHVRLHVQHCFGGKSGEELFKLPAPSQGYLGVL